MTSAASMTPETVSVPPVPAGQGGLSPPPQRNAATPPLAPRWPRWMCAAIAVEFRPPYESSYVIVCASSSITAVNVPEPNDDTAGTSWKPVKLALMFFVPVLPPRGSDVPSTPAESTARTRTNVRLRISNLLSTPLVGADRTTRERADRFAAARGPLRHFESGRHVRGQVLREHALDSRRARASVEAVERPAAVDEHEARHLANFQSAREIGGLLDVHARDPEPPALLAGQVREEALHPPARARALGGEEEEQRPVRRAFHSGRMFPAPPPGKRERLRRRWSDGAARRRAAAAGARTGRWGAGDPPAGTAP